MYRIKLSDLGIKSDVANEKTNINLEISPNPAQDYIAIKQASEGLKPSEGSKIEIYNIFGEKISTPSAFQAATPQEGNFKIDVSNLPAGVYFVKIGDKFEKFIKI